MLKFDAINLGERDFMPGPTFLLNMKKEYDLPFVSANVFQPDSTTKFTEPYVIKKLKGRKHGDIKIQPLKVGIFGIMLKRPTLVYANDEPKLISKDPIQIAEEIVNKIKGKCDIIIALAHLNTPQITELTTRVKEIDIVIGSHDYSKRDIPYKVNNAIVLQTGSKGQYVGDLTVNFSDDKKIKSFDGQIVKLDKTMKDDSDIKKLISEYDKEFGNFMKEQLARKK